jgi:nucleoside-diphosphate-sugar epimerase
MKIGIVGGTGNISQSIVRLLLEKGHEVVCFNRGQTTRSPEGVRVIQGDRSDREDFERKMQSEKFDAAIDMICFTAEDAASSIRAFRGVGWFVQTSTTCTYGIQYDYLPVDETHPLRPNTAYGRNKVAADDLYLEAYHRERFPVVIIKPSTTYGPVQGMLRQICWDFSWIDRVKKGKPILVCLPCTSTCTWTILPKPLSASWARNTPSGRRITLLIGDTSHGQIIITWQARSWRRKWNLSVCRLRI